MHGLTRHCKGWHFAWHQASAAAFAGGLAVCLAAPAGAQTPNAGAAPLKPLIAMVLPREEQVIEHAFRDYLARRGLQVRYEVLRYSGKAEDASALVEQVRRLKPDLIYSWGTPTTLALAGPAREVTNPAETASSPASRRYITDIPVVFTEVTDPVGSGLLATLRPPGRNVTGVSHVAPLAVQLNALRAYKPMRRLGYIVNPAESNSLVVRDQLRSLSSREGFELVEQTVPMRAGSPDPAALPGLVQQLAQAKVDWLYVGPSTFLGFTHRDSLTQAAVDAGLLTFCATESIVRKSKCLVGLFAGGSNVGRFAAHKARQVLVDGTPVAQVSAESLQRFSLLINMPVAHALKQYPPVPMLSAAEVLVNAPR